MSGETLDVEQYRSKRNNNEGLDFKINCKGQVFMGHKNLLASKSGYINSHVNFERHSVKDLMKEVNSIDVNDFTPEVIEVVMKMFYEEDYTIEDDKLVDTLRCLDFLLFEKAHKDLVQVIKVKTNNVEYSMEAFKSLWKVKDAAIHGYLTRALANNPQKYVEVYKSLNDEEKKTIFREKSLIFRDFYGNPCIFDDYLKAYTKFLSLITESNHDAIQLQLAVREILDDREKNNSDIFYGIPEELFVHPQEFGRHPREAYPRRSVNQLSYPGGPNDWHLEKIKFFTYLWEGAQKVTGMHPTYRNRKTNETRTIETNFSGSESVFELGSDEYITEFTMLHGYMMDGITFTTNKKKSQRWGSPTGGNTLISDINKINTVPLNGSLIGDNEIVLTHFYGFEYSEILSNSYTANDVKFIFAGFINKN